MKNNLVLSQIKFPSTVWLLAFTLLFLGSIFRFGNLDRIFFWHDEVCTLLRVAGYASTEIDQQIFNGNVIGIENLQKFQQLSPDKNVLSTIKSLANSEPQNAPFYYVIAYYWVRCFGNSIVAIRSLSAVISLLVFPLIYWLCLELFKKPLVGWVAIILTAISPFNLLFAQEARLYSLWIVTILLSSALLLRTIRRSTRLDWTFYSITAVIGLYTNLLFGLILACHIFYIALVEKFQWNRTVKLYSLSLLISFFAFIPWLFILKKYFSVALGTTSHTTVSIPLNQMIDEWVLNLSRLFIDFNIHFSLTSGKLVDTLLLVSIAVFTLYSIYYLIKKASRKSSLFILLLIATTSIPFIVLDLTLGGQRSTVQRYLIPSYLSIQLATSYLFATRIKSAHFSSNHTWKLILTVFILLGLLSCSVRLNSVSWWNKLATNNLIEIPKIINQADMPLILGSNPPGSNTGDLIALSYLLSQKVKFQLFSGYYSDAKIGKIDLVAAKSRELFLFNILPAFRQDLETNQECKIESIKGLDSSNEWLLSRAYCPPLSQ